MRFAETPIAGSWIIDPAPHHRRARALHARVVRRRIRRPTASIFVQRRRTWASATARGTIRGLHYQTAPNLEAKLVRCTRGAVFDVLVDLRPDSRDLWTVVRQELTADERPNALRPPMCAHGVQTLEDASEIFYMTSAPFCAGVRSRTPFRRSRDCHSLAAHSDSVSDQDRVGRSSNSRRSRQPCPSIPHCNCANTKAANPRRHDRRRRHRPSHRAAAWHARSRHPARRHRQPHCGACRAGLPRSGYLRAGRPPTPRAAVAASSAARYAGAH